MNAQALARDYLRKGKARRRALQVLFEEESYDDVVREAQAIVELILKGTLRFIGVDPPKRHDVGSTVKEFGDHLPENWRVRLDEIEAISRTLFEERGHAFYGDEASLTPASALFGEEDAQRAIRWVDELLELFEALLQDRQDKMPNGDHRRGGTITNSPDESQG
jgi:HEPN domain-containing protein